jgi:hypothetical protein
MLEENDSGPEAETIGAPPFMPVAALGGGNTIETPGTGAPLPNETAPQLPAEQTEVVPPVWVS